MVGLNYLKGKKMTKYSYKVNEETGLVERSVLETYPDTKIIERGISAGRNPELIKKQQLKALQGEAEAPVVAIEEDWFEQQQLIENLTAEVKTITDQLNGVEEVVDETTNEVLVEAVEKVTDEDVIKTLEDRLAIINDKIEYYFDDMGVKQNTTVLGELNTAKEARGKLEEDNQWLKAYRGETTDEVRPEPAAEVTKLPRTQEKELIAHERNLTIRNNEDSIADLAKMVSLAFSVISSLWEVTPDDAKESIDADKKGMIDYAVSKFNATQTRADDQLAQEGVALIDKLYDREIAIAGIVRKYD